MIQTVKIGDETIIYRIRPCKERDDFIRRRLRWNRIRQFILSFFFLIVLLLSVSTVAAAPHTNLMPNGSFEKGINNWEMHDRAVVVTGGRCGPHALNLEKGFARQVGYKLQAGTTYKLVFWYKGLVNVSVQNGEFLQSTEWKKFTHVFTADEQPTIWFMGFENNPILLDCIKLVAQ